MLLKGSPSTAVLAVEGQSLPWNWRLAVAAKIACKPTIASGQLPAAACWGASRNARERQYWMNQSYTFHGVELVYAFQKDSTWHGTPGWQSGTIESTSGTAEQSMELRPMSTHLWSNAPTHIHLMARGVQDIVVMARDVDIRGPVDGDILVLARQVARAMHRQVGVGRSPTSIIAGMVPRDGQSRRIADGE